MISESRIRKELVAIENATDHSLTRVRRYLRLARSVKEGYVRLLHLSWWHAEKNQSDIASRFYNAAKRLYDLSYEARNRARLALQRCGKLGFGYAPRGEAVPNWNSLPKGIASRGEPG